jgi:hypothetical protein
VDATRATEIIPSVPLGNLCLFSLVVSNSGSVVGGTFSQRPEGEKQSCLSIILAELLRVLLCLSHRHSHQTLHRVR